MNYYNVDSGKILIDNNRVIDYKIEHQREKIAFQSFFPRISLEFEDIVIDHEKLSSILKDLKINEEYYNESINKNPVNSQGLQISDSQKQMLPIA